MITVPRLQFRLAVVGVAAVLALSGCSAVGEVQSLTKKVAEVQSKAEACISLQKTMSGSLDTLTSSLGAVGTDPATAVAELEKVSNSFDAALAKVSNKEVAEAGTKAESALQDMITKIKAITADPQHADMKAFMTSVTTVQTAFTDVGKACR